MSVLWTDIIDPATLTGYIRQSLADYEARKGTLARWLPNRNVADTVVRFRVGQNGLVPEARYRAFDAEPEVGKSQGGKRVTIELPALSQEIPVSEYAQLRERNASDGQIRNSILATADDMVRSIADRLERLRGVVLYTGKATIAQSNYVSDDDFGRDSGLTVTATTLWSDYTNAKPLDYLQTLFDLYVDTNGEEPGAILTSNRVIRAMTNNPTFATTLVGGAQRAATMADVQALVTGAGLPPIVRYDRKTFSGRVIPDNKLLMLPAPVATDDWQGTQLGVTYWGQTLTGLDPTYGLVDDEVPGLVAGVYRNTKPPLIAEVIGDSINLPVLANANLSLVATVL